MGDFFNRDLMRGSFDMMVLSVLSGGPSYGYLIQKEIVKTSHGSAQIKAGTLYPLLHRLEAKGAIESKLESCNGRQRKWYTLTNAGKRHLRAQSNQWFEYEKCVLRFLARSAGEAKSFSPQTT